VSDDLFETITRDAAMPAPERPEDEHVPDGPDPVVFGSVPCVRGWYWDWGW
jgi:hypothetical protein